MLFTTNVSVCPLSNLSTCSSLFKSATSPLSPPSPTSVTNTLLFVPDPLSDPVTTATRYPTRFPGSSSALGFALVSHSPHSNSTAPGKSPPLTTTESSSQSLPSPLPSARTTTFRSAPTDTLLFTTNVSVCPLSNLSTCSSLFKSATSPLSPPSPTSVTNTLLFVPDPDSDPVTTATR